MKRKLRIPLAAALLSAAAAGTSLASVSVPVQTNISLQTEVTAVQAETAPVLTNESSGSQTAETTVTQAESPAPVQTGWVQDGSSWRYVQADGTYAASVLLVVDGVTYGFDANGIMVTGWQKFGDDWRYFESNGAMAVNAWRQDAGKWFYLGDTGAMLKNTATPDGYLVDETGARR